MKILKALIGAYVITMIGLFVLAFVLYKFQLKENIIQIGIIVVYILSNLVGGIIVGKSVGSKRYLAGILLGICYFALLTACLLYTSRGRPCEGNFYWIDRLPWKETYAPRCL